MGFVPYAVPLQFFYPVPLSDGVIFLFSVNLFPVPYTVQNDITAHDIIADPVRPDLKAPLTYPFAF